MGNDESSRFQEYILDKQLIDLRSKWEHLNNLKKNNYVTYESGRAGIYSLMLGVLGFAIGGPPGALAGAAFGVGGSAAVSYVNSC